MDATIDTVDDELATMVEAGGTLDLTVGQQRSLRVLTYQMTAALTELSDLLEAVPDDPAARSALQRALSAANQLTDLASRAGAGRDRSSLSAGQ